MKAFFVLQLFCALAFSLPQGFQRPGAGVQTAPRPVQSPSQPPQQNPSQVEIVNLENEVSPDGNFHYSLEQSDNTKISADGFPTYVDKDHVGQAVDGQYEYVGDDGKLYSVKYYADETGFHAEGEHIPKVPEAIARALEWAAEHPYKENP